MRLVRACAKVVVHVIDPGQPPGALSIPLTETLNDLRAFLDGIKHRIAEQFGGRLVDHLATDLPRRYIVQLATDLEADLVVVGTHGKGGLARLLLGSVSQYVVNNAPCAVLVARPKEQQIAVPEIEPACPKCVESQKASAGETLWCTQHSANAHARTHYEMPEGFAVGSMLLRPEA